MPRINNFTVNSNFPAVAQANKAFAVATMPSRSVPAGGEYSITQQVAIGSGDIISPIIRIDNTYYNAQVFSRIRGNFMEIVSIERTSATVATIVMYIQNIGGSTATHAEWTAGVYLNSFRIP